MITESERQKIVAEELHLYRDYRKVISQVAADIIGPIEYFPIPQYVSMNRLCELARAKGHPSLDKIFAASLNDCFPNPCPSVSTRG